MKITPLYYISLILLLLLVVSCTPSDSERCGDGFYYDAGLCYEIGVDGGGDSDTDSDGDTDTDADSDTDTDADSDTDSDTDTEPDGGSGPTGLGEYCEEQADCEGYDADYCLLDPQTGEGICTIQNCNTAPDDCPEEWWCCILPAITGMPPVCLPDSAYKDYIDICENE